MYIHIYIYLSIYLSIYIYIYVYIYIYLQLERILINNVAKIPRLIAATKIRTFSHHPQSFISVYVGHKTNISVTK